MKLIATISSLALAKIENLKANTQMHQRNAEQKAREELLELQLEHTAAQRRLQDAIAERDAYALQDAKKLEALQAEYEHNRAAILHRANQELDKLRFLYNPAIEDAQRAQTVNKIACHAYVATRRAEFDEINQKLHSFGQ